MRIEIWSDVVCPWCYIGKRRLETALSTFEHADEVEIVWRSFELDPSTPRDATETVVEHLGAKYGGGAAAGQQMIDRVEAVAAEEGLVFRLGQAKRANTVDAHRLLHLADTQGLQSELKEALLDAYFVQTRDVGDHDVLAAIAAEVGLDPERVGQVLSSGEFQDAVEDDVRTAVAFGTNGVPFFVVDRKYAVSGAQPAETFSQLLETAWDEAHPVLQLVGGADEVCGPDGCAM